LFLIVDHGTGGNDEKITKLHLTMAILDWKSTGIILNPKSFSQMARPRWPGKAGMAKDASTST